MGSILSTMHLNACVYYDLLFAITIEFFSKQEVQTELDIAKVCRVVITYSVLIFIQTALSAMSGQTCYWLSFVVPQALNMIWANALPGKLPKSYLCIDPYFQCKLGKTIKSTSLYTTVDASLGFLKAKLLSFSKSDHYVWGLIKSLHIELPSRMLRGRGCLIDSPGTISSTASVVYVSQTVDFQNKLAWLLESPFAQHHLPKIWKIYKDNTLQTMPTQWIFVFPSDKSLQN